MQNIILFGGTGHAGKAVARELLRRSFRVTLVARDPSKAQALAAQGARVIQGDPLSSAAIDEWLAGQDAVVSTLGKSVSPFDRGKPTFRQVDYEGNMRILRSAMAAGIRKFVYISAFHAERYPHLEYFRVHEHFSRQLERSGLDYSIIKPPAIFSAFQDLMVLASRGQMVHIGSGGKKTNPIYEGDLARVVCDALAPGSRVVEAGGPKQYTRRALNEIIQEGIRPGKKVRTIPMGLVQGMLPLLKIFDRNLYDKMAFFLAVSAEDIIAPVAGTMLFEDYVQVCRKNLKL
jgi:uncharacterized protein YbjT (DUF2867 family)